MDTPPESPIREQRVRAAKGTNRRIHERIPINSRLAICYRDRSSISNSIRARAVDVSKAGILVEAERPVPIGTVVELQTANSTILGRAAVRHCTSKGAKFWIGLYVPDRLLRTF
jgi:PilZ domain-containing protein